MHVSDLLCGLTSAHAVVVSQHISSGTHAFIRTKGVDATEGAKQRILGALVDVLSQKERWGDLIYSVVTVTGVTVALCGNH